jgi:tRNA nucleotidyltransferase (CCA-adding enzyme)
MFLPMISGVGAVRDLREYHDVIAEFLPELEACVGFAQNTKYHCYDVYEHSLRALEANDSQDLITRLSILLHDVGKPLTYTEDEQGGHFKGHGAVGVKLTGDILRRLRFDNATADAVVQLVEYHDRPIPAERKAVKRLMQKMTDENIMRLLELQRCDRVAHAPEYATPPNALAEIPRLMQELRAEDACLSLRSLAVKGGDLMALGVPAGKLLGTLLQRLLDEVVEEHLPNERDALMNAAREWLRQIK